MNGGHEVNMQYRTRSAQVSFEFVKNDIGFNYEKINVIMSK